MVKAFNEILRDFTTDGVPSSGPHQPIKADFREALTAVEAFTNASGSALVYQDRATLFADLAHDANIMAWVVNDATVAYNGIYQKSGASGAGSWTRVADLPYSFIVATNSGAGTANAIQATTAIPVTSSALVILPIVATASSAPITVSFNGGTALTILTVSGNNASALTTGMWVLGVATGSNFRLVNDQDVASLVAQAEAARDDAVAAAASINQRIYTTLSDAVADTIPATVKRLRTQFRTPNYAISATLVGGANYRRISFADLTGYPTQSYFRSVDRFMPDGTTDATNGGYWLVDEPIILPEMLGALGDGTTDDAPAINAAIVLKSLLGGGTIGLQAKTYAVGNQNSGAVSTFDHWAIVFDQGHDNVELIGVKGSKIKLLNAANCTVIQIGRNTNTTPPSNIRISGIEIDGNRANQDAPLAASKHWPGLMAFIFGGVSERIIIEDMYIHDCQYYGIGFEMEDVAGTEFHDCHVRNVVIEDTGADGFDAKDYQNGSLGNTIENITVRRWGLANAASALLSGQAGIDLRSGWVVENAFIDEGNAATIPDQVGIRIQRGSLGATATPVQPSRVSKFTCRGSNEANSVGLRAIAIYCTASDGHIENFGYGISASNQHCKFENIVSKLNGTGALFWATGGTTATLSSLEGCNIRDNTGTGVVVTGVDSVSILNTHVRSNLLGINIDASSGNFVFIGGSLSGNTPQATITTVIPYIRDVVGFRTKRTYSTVGAIDSLGSKDITFAHGLPFTPRIQDCQVSFRQSSAVTDWAAAFLEVLSVDATNVVVRYRVDTASVTAGALVGINLVVDAYNGI